MLAGLIIMTLAVIAVLTLGGMAFMMTVDAFGILPAVLIVAGLGLFGVALWGGPAPTIATLALVGGLVLLGLSVSMIIGAIIGRRTSISSWPMQQEQQFQSFEQRTSGSHSSAMIAGIGAAIAVFLFIVGVRFGVEPDRRNVGDTMNMSNLTKKSKAPAPAPAPKTETPDPAPEAPAPAPEAPAPAPK